MTTRKFNKLLISLGVTITLLTNAYPQASRTVMVQSNTGVLLFPTNLFTANASSARSGLSLATHATNPIVPVTSGGSGATNAATARTNLGLGATWLTNTTVANFNASIGLGTTNSVSFAEATLSTGALVLSGGAEDDVSILNESSQLQINLQGGPAVSFGAIAYYYIPIEFSNATNIAITRTNLGLPLAALTNTSASSFRSAISLGATWLTNTSVTNFRTAVGLGEQNAPRFAAVLIGDTNISFESTPEDEGMNFYFNRGTNASEPAITIGYLSNSILSFLPILFQSNSHAATTRTNLGLPLAALTNVSNVTTMRALSGSTNTNHPFSGTISVTGTNNTNTLTFSNGILQSVQ